MAIAFECWLIGPSYNLWLLVSCRYWRHGLVKAILLRQNPIWTVAV